MRYGNLNITTTRYPVEANAVTHAGTFHMDECMATVLIAEVCSKPIVVYRAKKFTDDLAGPLSIVYDIGGGEFDHHQPGGNGVRPNGVPYASAGLIWRKYGRTIVENCLGAPLNASPENVDWVWEYVDRELIQGIDANDTGTLPARNFACNCLDVSGIIRYMNPTWDDLENHDESLDEVYENKQFLKAVKQAAKIFSNVIDYASSAIKARSLVIKAVTDVKDTKNGDGAPAVGSHVAVLPSYLPWLDHIFNLGSGEIQKAANNILYIVYPAKRGGYQFRVVPIQKKGSYSQRNHVPESWLGLNGQALIDVCGVSDADFVHPNGFIGGAKSSYGATEMAMLAIEQGTLDKDYKYEEDEQQ